MTRDLEKDVAYTTFVPASLEEIEGSLPRGTILTAFSGFRAKMGKTPGEYGQVFVYSDSDEVQRSFKPTQRERRNLFVLRSDEHLAKLSKGGVVPVVQLYVDLWQLGTPASRFVDELEKELSPAPTRALGEVARALKKPT